MQTPPLPEAPLSLGAIIVVALFFAYLLVGIGFFVYMAWDDQRQRRFTAANLLLGAAATTSAAFAICLLAWPLLALLYPWGDDAEEERQRYLGPDK